MSQTDSFIDEVTEEVRRERLFGLMKRYGWIAILAVVLLVGGAAWNEWRKAQSRQAAEALGDSLLAALQMEDGAARAEALGVIEPPNPQAAAMVDLMAAAELAGSDPAAASERLTTLADSPDVATIYRQIAILKAASLAEGGLDAQTRRSRLEGLALGSGLVRLLAEEQLAYLDVEEGDAPGAIERLQQIIADEAATAALRRRASQVIVALGGELPEEPADAG